MPDITTATASLHYRHEGSGPPVILVHGNWTTSLFWQPIISRLAENYSVVAPDLRGRGQSRANHPDYAITDLATDLDAVLEHVGLSSVDLVGHSLGAAVVLEWAMRHRDRVRSLTLVSPAWPDGMPAMHHQPDRQRASQDDIDVYAKAFRAIAPTAPKDALFEALIVEGHKQSPEATLATLDALTQWAPGERLRMLQGIPALVISGALDTLSTMDVGARCATLLGGKHHLMRAMGHSPNLEAPDAFAARLREFLLDVEARQTRPDARTQEMALARAAEILARARSALFITGAGISVASGLPTYRGANGLWTKMGEKGEEAQVVMSLETLAKDPAAIWRHARMMYEAGRSARPNAAHEAIAKLEKRMDRVCVLTQNVDGLHRMAGSTNVIEIHGELKTLRCTACAWRGLVSDWSNIEFVPHCSECGAVLRPDVVLFGETIADEKYNALVAEVAQGFDVVVSIGTSSLFPYIMEPVFRAADQGKHSIEINPETTRLSSIVTVKLSLGAVPAFEAIMPLIEKKRAAALT